MKKHMNRLIEDLVWVKGWDVVCTINNRFFLRKTFKEKRKLGITINGGNLPILMTIQTQLEDDLKNANIQRKSKSLFQRFWKNH